MNPTPEEMRRVAAYMSSVMGLHSAAGKLISKANKLDEIVEQLMNYKREDK